MDQLQSHFEIIADDLAEKGICVLDGFLSHDECDAIRGLPMYSGSIENLRRAGIGKETRQVSENVRGDFIQWLDPEQVPDPLQSYIDKLRDLRLFLNRSLFLGLQDMEVHAARYPAGAYYKRHLDQFSKDDHRRISVICYLNRDWQDHDGGSLRVYHEHGFSDHLPLEGRLVCFRSDLLEHEVLPATRERQSITGWLLDRLKV